MLVVFATLVDVEGLSYLGISDLTGTFDFESEEQSTETKGRVGFSAVAAEGSLGDLKPHQTIVFRTVYTNVGDGYDHTTGIFTAPVSGLYQFFASVMADQGKEVWAVFELNNTKTLSRIYARGTDNRHAQGSQTVILELRKGDSIKVLNERNTRIYGDSYTSFSGFLIG